MTMPNQPQQPLAEDSLKELADQKEKEWRELQNLRTQSLEAALKDKDRRLDEEKAKFQKLKEDFKYNLKLLGERDAELDKYDSMFTELKTALSVKDGEISDLKIKMAELQTSVAREVKSQEDLQTHYQHRLKEKQTEVDQYRNVKNAELNQERQELESFKRNLERKIKELEEELDIQRRELTTSFEETMRKREHEYRVQADQMSSTVLAHELKVKLLSKELEMVKSSQSQTTKEFQEAENSQRQLEKKIKQKDWELSDLRAIKDAKIAELESKLHQTELSMKRMQEEFKRKHEEVDRYGREKEAALTKVKEAAHERERHLQDTLRDYQSQLEDAQIKYRQLEWSKQDLAKDKDGHIEKLQEELVDVKSKWDSQLAEISRDQVAKDLDKETSKDREQQLKVELAQRKEDIDRYKRELNDAVEREASLERAKAQLELDWQRRYEELERMQYDKSEDLIRNLSKARDEAQADLKQVRRELEQRENLIQVLTTDRDQALATLKRHGMLPDRNVDMSILSSAPRTASDHIEQLQQQNNNLRAVIQQMRQEMEQLENQLPAETPRSKVHSDSVTTEYVKNLEQELQKAKAKCRKLEQAATDGGKTEEVWSEKDAVSAAGDNVLVQTHVQTLHNTIGTLRSEKVELSAQVRKQQARTQYLENMVDQLSKEPRQKQVAIDQLQYELGAQVRRHQAEVSGLRQQVANMELQLIEARKEADEYFKGTLETNMEAKALGTELSALKLDIARNIPTVNFGAQELVIQQLQDEIKRLRSQQRGEEPMIDHVTLADPMRSGQGMTTNSTIADLQNKLRMAAKHIGQLAKDKQQLIEMGNRLRAELKKAGIQPPSAPARHVASATPLSTTGMSDSREHATKVAGSASYLSGKIQSKLNELEKLQYEITKQKLSQHGQTGPFVPPVVLDDHSSTDTDTDSDPAPRSILKTSQRAVKLSPVPEDHIVPPRPRTADPDMSYRPHISQSDVINRPYTADSDVLSSRPGTAQSNISHLSSVRSDSGHQRVSSPSRDQALIASLSSVGGESLQDVWRMLADEEKQPAFITPRNSSDAVTTWADLQSVPGKDTGPASGSEFSLQGQPTPLQHKPLPERKKLSAKAQGKVAKSNAPPKQKIRNYNVRD